MIAKRWGLLATGAALLWAPMAAAQVKAPACAIDKATYRLKGEDGFRAGFVKRRYATMSSDLMFWVRTPKRTYWFEFQSPNGVGGTWIFPSIDPKYLDAENEREDGEPSQAIKDLDASVEAAKDPDTLKDITFDAFDSDLATFTNPPTSEDAAPARIFIRGIGQALWYSYTWAAGGDPKAEQDSIPTAMWEPEGCSGGD